MILENPRIPVKTKRISMICEIINIGVIFFFKYSFSFSKKNHPFVPFVYVYYTIHTVKLQIFE
jgi:hypothetical protein